MRSALVRFVVAACAISGLLHHVRADLQHGSLEALVAVAQDLKTHIAAQKVQHNHKVSRGIVIAAGGSDQLANALATVQVLRHNLSCHLHIEVVYHGEDEAEAELISQLEDLPAVKALDTSKIFVPKYHYIPDNKVGYFKKILAIYASSFDQLLYLDADNHPLQDPSKWFDWPDFKKFGNVFWPDYMGAGRHESVKPEIYQVFKLPLPWETDKTWKCSESGQFLFDRRKHLDVMEWILFVNAQHETTYQYIYGDKDSFELAFNLADKGKQYNRVKYGPRASFRPLEDGNYGHTGMLQTNAKGEPLFFHQVAGGKFYISTKELPQPQFGTLGISIPALDAMDWGNDIGSLKLRKDRSVEYSSIECQHLDSQTAQILAKQDKKRWSKCSKAASIGVPLPLIPLDKFPAYVSTTINALVGRFRTVQQTFKDSGVNEM